MRGIHPGVNEEKSMKCKRHWLHRAICVGLGTGLLAASTMVWAQSPESDEADSDDPQEQASLDRVEVTGSRIRRIDIEGPNPVQVFDRDYIDASGAQTVADFLFQAQFAGPGLFNENSTLSQFQGSAFFDSRGLGANYTLILIDGKRLPTTPLGGLQATDINQLPLAAIDRIEYLSDGASAIYGSDAIAGVINIITKREFNGLSLRGQAGMADDGDGERMSSEIVGGASGDDWRALIAFDWYKQNDIDATDRPLAESAIAPDGTDGRSPTGLPGTFVVFDPQTGAFPEAIPQDGCPESRLRPTEFAATGFDCAFDFATLYDIVPASRSYNLLSKYQYDFSSRLTGTFQWRHSNTQVKVRNGAAPAVFSLGPEDNPTGEPAFFVRRFVDAGPRARDTTNTTNSFLVQLDYTMGLHDLEVYALATEVENNQVGVSGQISTRRVEEAVVDGTFDPLQTYDPQFFIDQGLAVGTQRQATGDQKTVGATLSGYLPFDLGNRPVGYAVGGSWLDDAYFDISDGDAVDGDIAGGAGSFGGGDRQTRSVYAEFNLTPIESLELSLAARHDDISNIAGEATFRAAASFRPTDRLLLRAGYGTGFRAPSLGELFLGRSFGVVRAVDTTFCNQVRNDPSSTPAEIDAACRTREIRSLSGGNPELGPETSASWSAGFAFEPIDRLIFKADYWNIEVEDKVGSLSVQEILNNEDRFPDLVNRVNGQLTSPDAFVRSNLQNLTLEEGSGLDLSVLYSVDTDLGRFGIDLRTHYLLEYLRQSSALQPLCDDAGTTSEPEWRSNLRLQWSRGDWESTVLVRHVGSTEDLVGGRANGTCTIAEGGRVRSVDAYTQVDLQTSYHLNGGTRLTLGIRNLFEEEPPFSEIAAGGWPWFDQALYDITGRSFYLRADHRF
jgi:iron complex outermembrane receptor protein